MERGKKQQAADDYGRLKQQADDLDKEVDHANKDMQAAGTQAQQNQPNPLQGIADAKRDADEKLRLK